MVQEVLEGLQPGPGKVFLDGTLGYGGHAAALLAAAGTGAQLIGLDKDTQALAAARKHLAAYEKQIMLCHLSYQDFDQALSDAGVTGVDGMLLDLGVSSAQLDQAERGFSFQSKGPLDMRMDPQQSLTAEDIVNDWSVTELADLIYHFGEEPLARRYARAIDQARHKQRITNTHELENIIFHASPKRHSRRIHPATRTFQALRIAVNHELEDLDIFLDKFSNFLKPAGRIAILSYHSLEDRRVKQAFREAHRRGHLHILTKKPLRPGEEEIQQNPRARSAKLRIAAKQELS